MIKHLRFAAEQATPEPVAAAWHYALAAARRGPADTRPLRAVLCTALVDETPDPAHPVVAVMWFTDVEHLTRFERWHAASGRADDAALGPGSVVVAAEHVMRGAGWLDRRWGHGGEMLKHMAVAGRAPGLTTAEFSERWRERAGRVGTTAIPDIAKGRAYAQNHPIRGAWGDARYDAVNEVWFDDLDALRARIRWMDDALAAGGDDDFIGESNLFALREVVVS